MNINKKPILIVILSVFIAASCVIGVKSLSADKTASIPEAVQSDKTTETDKIAENKETAIEPAEEKAEEISAEEKPSVETPEPDATPAQPAQVAQADKPVQAEPQEHVSRGGTRTITVVATGYTDAPEENYPWAGAPSYIGLPLERGIVAVDPDVIPMGTKLYIEGYGDGIAADQGGAIKGNRIDLFFDTKAEAFDWGMRTVEVTIIQ